MKVFRFPLLNIDASSHKKVKTKLILINLILGLVGGVIGGVIGSILGISGGWIVGLILSVVGACILIWLYRKLFKK